MMISRQSGSLFILISLVAGFFTAPANLQCTFQDCPTKSESLTEGGPLTLPCNISTPINTSSTTTGNYTYCYNATILVPQTNSSYTIENIDYTLDKSIICCFDNEAQSCAVCYNFTVYYKPRNRNRFSQGATANFGEPYTFNCEVIANPSPVCEWTRAMTFFNASSFTIHVETLPITPDAVYTNNNCTLKFNRLQEIHNGRYSCNATNSLGSTRVSFPTIRLVACSSKSTQIDYTGPPVVMASVGDSVTVKCSVGSTSRNTIIRFYFNNTSYDHRSNEGMDIGIAVNSTFNLDDCSVHSTLIIRQFSEQFEGQYSCSASTVRPTQIGDNVTFSLEVASLQAEKSSSSENTGVLIGAPLGALFALLSVITITIILLILIRRRLMTSILRLPPPPYSTDKYQYDMFISHAQDTDDYVSITLKKGLMEKGYRVQTPVDFVAGHSSDENIINAFMSSRYVMILFSEAYDHNCSELRYAYNKVDETNYNCLIPVKCGGVIPAKLERITYADYDDDDVVSRVEQTIGRPLYGA